MNIQRFPELAQIAIVIFTISHGQADVERGFSVNSSVIDVNMKEETIKNKRLIRDHMQSTTLSPAILRLRTV